jgi:hypothetical protein
MRDRNRPALPSLTVPRSAACSQSDSHVLALVPNFLTSERKATLAFGAFPERHACPFVFDGTCLLRHTHPRPKQGKRRQ